MGSTGIVDQGELVAFGRTMDDGRFYAMLVDVVVKGRGLGREIVNVAARAIGRL